MPRLLATCLVLCLAATAAAANWPQWLGPTRDGVSTEVVQPWKEPLKILWKQPVGEGHSSPVVAGGKVYLHAKAKDKNAEELVCFDRDGKPLWTGSYETRPYTGLFGNGPRATPTVAGGKVYTHGISGMLACFDGNKGDVLWKVDTSKELKAPALFFGSSCSPLVEGNRVLVNVGAKGASIAALDRDKGTVDWKVLDDKASYASPIAIGKGTQRQAVFLTGAGLVAVEVATGAVLWRYPFVDKLAESSTTPVLMGDLLIGSSITLGSVGLKLENKEGKATAEKRWLNENLTSYFSTPVPVQKHLYLVTGTKPPALATKADMHCVDPETGKILWTRPKVGAYHASLLRTGDGKLLLLEEKGDLVLVAPDPKEYRELCRSKICGNTWAHPALSDGRLYIRDGKELVCVQLP